MIEDLIPILFALVISSRVVTFCFFGLNNWEGVEGVLSITKVDSRSEKSN